MCLPMTKIIHLVAGPGAGKTTLASAIFTQMKLLGLKVEFLQEHVKTLVLLEKFDELNDQYNLSKTQYQIMKQYVGKVDYLLLDFSLLIGLYHNKFNKDNVSKPEETEKQIVEWFREFDNLVLYVERGDIKFEEFGRMETYGHAREIDRILLQYLDKFNIPYISVSNDLNTIGRTVNMIKSSLMLDYNTTARKVEEWERKFLIRKDIPLTAKSVYIEQGYLGSPTDSYEIRYRNVGGQKFYVEHKCHHVKPKIEISHEITKVDFMNAWPYTHSKISKHRYIISEPTHDSSLWITVDVYEGHHAGLVIAEVEGTKHDVEAFEPLKWMDREVTNEEEYQNRNLKRRKCA